MDVEFGEPVSDGTNWKLSDVCQVELIFHAIMMFLQASKFSGKFSFSSVATI